MASLELLSTSYKINTVKCSFLFVWHKHISLDDHNVIWFEPIRFKKLAKRVYGANKLDQKYFDRFGMDLKTIP